MKKKATFFSALYHESKKKLLGPVRQKSGSQKKKVFNFSFNNKFDVSGG